MRHRTKQSHIPVKKMGLFLLSLLVIEISVSTLGFTQDSSPTDYIHMSSSLDKVSFWWRNQKGQIEPKILAPFFEEQIPILKNHWLFNDKSMDGKFPEQWAIRLDTTWSLSEGFWSPTLTSPDSKKITNFDQTHNVNQVPAIILNPVSLFENHSATSLLIHEMAHLAHYQYRPHEESWVREGVALLAEHVLNQYVQAQAMKSKAQKKQITFRPVYFNSVYQDGFITPETSLIQVTDLKNLSAESQSLRRGQYGHLLQYFHYLYRLCGGEDFFKDLVKSSSQLKGIEFLDFLLKNLFEKKSSLKSAHPICSSFKDSFKAFEIARFKQDFSEPSRFLYPTSWTATIRSTPQELPSYSAMAYDLKEGESCPSRDIEWGSSRCIRIRFE
jgi:hypothetical protein